MKKYVIPALLLIAVSITACKKDSPVIVKTFAQKIEGQWDYVKYEYFFEPADPANTHTFVFDPVNTLEFLPIGPNNLLLKSGQQETSYIWTGTSDLDFNTDLFEDLEIVTQKLIFSENDTHLVIYGGKTVSPGVKNIVKLTLIRP